MEDKENEVKNVQEMNPILELFLKRISAILSIKGLLAVCLAVLFSWCIATSMLSPNGVQVPETVATLFSMVVASFFQAGSSTKTEG